MRPAQLWVAAALLMLGALAILFVWVPSRQPKASREGVRTDGTVLMKDSRQSPNGDMAYYVRFIFPDENHQNHDAESEVDKGTWDQLKPNQEVKVRYLPSNPSQAAIEGAIQAGGPRSTGLKFLALSMLVAAAACVFYALRAFGEAPQGPMPRAAL